MRNISTAFLSTAAFFVVAGAAVAGNQVYIDQINENYAESYQDCTGGVCSNYGDIRQVNDTSGAINNASLRQVTPADNTALMAQQGVGNNVVVRQRNGSYADTQQLNAEGGWVTVNQDMDDTGGTLAGFNNSASAYQNDGIRQVALIKQFGDDGEAHTRQNGDENQVKIIQNAGSVGEYVHVTQTGMLNWADVVMNGRGNNVVVGQVDDANNMDVDVAETADNSSITAYQTGWSNNGKLFTNADNNTLLFEQNGMKNYGEVVQLGNDQTAQVYQGGTENNTFVGQYEGAIGSTAAVHQDGTGHNARIDQNAPNSTASITQAGIGGVAFITQ